MAELDYSPADTVSTAFLGGVSQEYSFRQSHISAQSIDLEGGEHSAGAIYGFAAMQAGPARGHGFEIDQDTLRDAAKAGNAEGGVKIRFGHPRTDKDAIGTTIGKAKNFRVDGDTLRADAHFFTAAREIQNDWPKYLMRLASEDTSVFGASAVVVGAPLSNPDSDALSFRVAMDAERPLRAVDFVDEPAATSAVFSAKQEAPQMNEKKTEALDAEIKELRKRDEERESELKALREEAEALRSARETERRVRQLREAESLFESALREGKVWPAERDIWLGEYDEAGHPKLDDEGKPANLGMAVVNAPFFRAYLETQPQKHSAQLQGGQSAHIEAQNARAAYEARLAEKRDEFMQKQNMDLQTATLQAHQYIVANEERLHVAYRQELRQDRRT